MRNKEGLKFIQNNSGENSILRNSTILNFQFSILNSRRAGFTLLELLIAILILSIIAVIIGSGFRLGIKAWDKGESETYETQKLRVISSLLYQQVKSAYPFKAEIAGKNVSVFQGESDSILFATAFAAKGGFRWVSYSFKDGSLMFKEGILPDKKFMEKAEKTSDMEVIDRNITDFKFEYLSPEDEEWKDSWDMSENIPRAVRVKVAYFHPFSITIPLGLKNSDEKESGGQGFK